MNFHNVNVPVRNSSLSNFSGQSMEATVILGGGNFGAQSPSLNSIGSSKPFNAQKTFDGLQENYYKMNKVNFVQRNISKINLGNLSNRSIEQLSVQQQSCTAESPCLKNPASAAAAETSDKARGTSQLSSYAMPLPATGINIIEAMPRCNDIYLPASNEPANWRLWS